MDKFNILLLDDVKENLYSLKMLIEDNFDVNIFLSSDAQGAMKILFENPVDLILSDVQMPDVDGFEFVQYLKEIDTLKSIPIIFITGIYDKDEYKAKGYSLGAIEYITKPINNDLLISKLKIYIDIYNTIKEDKRKLDKAEKLLIQNSKMASMGEMIALIAHQLKQPLNTISLCCQDMTFTYDIGNVNDDFMKRFKDNTKSQIAYMNDTINGFLDFFNPNKRKEEFLIESSINKALDILRGKIVQNNTKIDFDIAQDDLKSFGVQTELTQAILNIINNSLDAFHEQKIIDGEIHIKLFKKEDKNIIILEDNAGGVENNNLNKILEPYFTTKEEGTGVGLYMVKMIVENSFTGELKVSNTQNGLNFIILIDSI